jgi:hypothetical protein
VYEKASATHRKIQIFLRSCHPFISQHGMPSMSLYKRRHYRNIKILLPEPSKRWKLDHQIREQDRKTTSYRTAMILVKIDIVIQFHREKN